MYAECLNFTHQNVPAFEIGSTKLLINQPWYVRCSEQVSFGDDVLMHLNPD